MALCYDKDVSPQSEEYYDRFYNKSELIFRMGIRLQKEEIINFEVDKRCLVTKKNKRLQQQSRKQ